MRPPWEINGSFPRGTWQWCRRSNSGSRASRRSASQQREAPVSTRDHGRCLMSASVAFHPTPSEQTPQDLITPAMVTTGRFLAALRPRKAFLAALRLPSWPSWASALCSARVLLVSPCARLRHPNAARPRCSLGGGLLRVPAQVHTAAGGAQSGNSSRITGEVHTCPRQHPHGDAGSSSHWRP